MAYFKINNTDFSSFVSGMSVSTAANYSIQTNAAGNSVVDYINSKRTIKITTIPLTGEQMKELQKVISSFSVSVAFRNPKTNELEENVSCIVPESEAEYYTIQIDKVLYNAASLTFTEL